MEEISGRQSVELMRYYPTIDECEFVSAFESFFVMLIKSVFLKKPFISTYDETKGQVVEQNSTSNYTT